LLRQPLFFILLDDISKTAEPIFTKSSMQEDGKWSVLISDYGALLLLGGATL